MIWGGGGDSNHTIPWEHLFTSMERSCRLFFPRALRVHFAAARAHLRNMGTLITSLDGHATFYIHGKWNVSREWARTAAKCTSSEKNGRC